MAITITKIYRLAAENRVFWVIADSSKQADEIIMSHYDVNKISDLLKYTKYWITIQEFPITKGFVLAEEKI